MMRRVCSCCAAMLREDGYDGGGTLVRDDHSILRICGDCLKWLWGERNSIIVAMKKALEDQDAEEVTQTLSEEEYINMIGGGQ